MVDGRAVGHFVARDRRYGRRARGRDGVDSCGAVRGSAEEIDVEQLGPIAATAAWLHGTAGRIAAGPGMPITALDVAESLPEAFLEATA